MTLDEAISKYVEQFGGFPYFLVMGAPDQIIIELIEESLRTGEEIKMEEGAIY